MPDDLDDGGLFEVESVERVETHSAAAKPPVDKTFRRFDPDQGLLLPPSLDDWLPAEHLARFIAELVDEHLDLSRIHAAYAEGRGGPPYDPRLMVRILLYGYTIGVRSSRVIETKCVDDVPFRWLAAGAAPDYRAIARFRKRHLSALGHLFVQALALCQAAGMVSLGRVALDGTKVRANASKRKAMSYARMWRRRRSSPKKSRHCCCRRSGSIRPRTRNSAKTAVAMSYPRSCGAARPGWPRSAKPKPPWRKRPRKRPATSAEATARERGDDDDTVTARAKPRAASRTET